MAINPELDNGGALALTPRRVNIFAKPEDAAAERSSRPRPKTIFDPAAACQRGDDDRHDDAASPWAQRASARVPRAGIARLIVLTGLALVIALLALRPAGPATSDRSHPRARQHHTVHVRGEQRRHARAGDAARRPRTRRRAQPHRAPRQHRTRLGVAPKAIQRPVPAAPAPAPALALPAPRRTAPAQPLPVRVPRSAPPEFM